MIHAIHILAVSLAILAAESPRDRADSADRAVLRRVAQMPRKQQQAWLWELKSRLEQANPLREARRGRPPKRPRRRNHAAENHRLSDWLQLIRELDDREKDAVGALVSSIAAASTRRFPTWDRPSTSEKRRGVAYGGSGRRRAVPATGRIG